MKAIFKQGEKGEKKQVIKKKKIKRVRKAKKPAEATVNTNSNGSITMSKTVAIWCGIAVTLASIVFASGKIVASIQINAIAIQANDIAIHENQMSIKESTRNKILAIEHNSIDISSMKVDQAVVRADMKNLKDTICEIRTDVKAILNRESK